ncbi:MAG: CPBP family intramembrane metalloprotease, partial [Erysipelotrichaceae bacterium]|nr:CPBP family intramembrane metalloprotease [Erysipelotrichaceae bacterium]
VFCILFAAGLAFLVQMALGKSFALGLGTKNLGKCLILGWIPAVTAAFNIFSNINNFSPAVIASVPMALLTACYAGLGEEFIYRGIFTNNMMRVLKSRKNGIYLALTVPAAIFGLSHLINGFAVGFGSELFIQTAYSVALGLVFGAMYLRTRSLLGCIILHTLIDFCSFIFMRSTGSADIVSYEVIVAVSVIFLAFLTIGGTAAAFYMVRKSKHAEILANWEMDETEA